MEYLQLLQKMDKYNLFTHAINTNDEPLPGIPIAHQALSSHYLVKDDKIIFVGTADGIANFVRLYKAKPL